MHNHLFPPTEDFYNSGSEEALLKKTLCRFRNPDNSADFSPDSHKKFYFESSVLLKFTVDYIIFIKNIMDTDK